MVLPERIFKKDAQGNYYFIEKLKLFTDYGLINYAQYAIKYPEGTDIIWQSPKFLKLLQEGKAALKEYNP